VVESLLDPDPDAPERVAGAVQPALGDADTGTGDTRTGRVSMSDCECLAGCAFFNDQMAEMPATASLLKTLYCRGDSTECARHVVFKALGKSAVPTDLYPSELERAHSLVEPA
jgi:hypothetical protein